MLGFSISSDRRWNAAGALAEQERMRATITAQETQLAYLREQVDDANDLRVGESTALTEVIKGQEIEIAKLHARIEEIQKRADIAQNNAEWMRVMLNRAEEQNAALFQRVLSVSTPRVEIDRPNHAPLTQPSPVGVSETLVGQIASGIGIDFEDVGDDTARKMGLDHPDDK